MAPYLTVTLQICRHAAPWIIAGAAAAVAALLYVGKLPQAPQHHLQPTPTEQPELSIFLTEAVRAAERMAAADVAHLHTATNCTSAEIESDLAEQLSITVDTLRERIDLGLESLDPLLLAQSKVLSGGHRDVLEVSLKVRKAEMPRLARIVESLRIDALAHAKRHEMEECLKSRQAIAFLIDEETEPLALADAQIAVAQSLMQLYHLDEADAALKEAHRIRNSHLGVSDPATTDALEYLMAVKIFNGSASEVEQLTQRILAIKMAELVNDHPEPTKRIHARAVNCYQTEKFDEAETFYRQALAIDEERFGKDSTEAAVDLNNLAGSLVAQSKPDDAAPLHRRALANFLRHHKETGKAHKHERSVTGLYLLLMRKIGRDLATCNKTIREMKQVAGLKNLDDFKDWEPYQHSRH